ncbi:MAG: glycoside hydrolase family 92 protein [Clostridia bacterium]|nr:glycoside hydrolase family 92 protein [Clostridia bacterium]
MKYLQQADPFHGNGTIDLPAPEGIAASWHFIKGLTGNTHPGAVLPFGKYSVCPYTGGYPTGYGINKINSGEPIGKLMEEMRFFGFSHFHHSGTGAVGIYYNYAIVTPSVDGEKQGYTPVGETASPGYYSVRLAEPDIFCELTVSPAGAYHRYTFPEGGGQIAVDFTNDGLYGPPMRGTAEDLQITRVSDTELRAAVTLRNVRFAFVCRFTGGGALDENGVYHIKDAGTVLLTVSAGTTSMEDTLREADLCEPDFDSARKAAEVQWEEALGRIAVEDTEDETERKLFYSNLYHTLIKPCDWGAGGFLWEGAPFVVDFTTLWDIYKTTLPLIFTLYPAVSAHIADTYDKLGQVLGKLPHCFILTTNTNIEAKQARLNAEHMLYDAWIRGVPADWDSIFRQIKKDIYRPDFRDFTEAGECPKTTHTLDMAEGCHAVAELAEKLGYTEDAAVLYGLSGHWKNAFDPETGLLRENSDYYEGNHWNYSFRPLRHMEERIAMAGGSAGFEALLDRFFGFTAPEDVSGRFEGFNNETDMETPWAYAYIGRHDKLTEILQAADRYMFRTGEGSTGWGGIPGNNDSGGLSGCYIWNCLGLFPVSGQNLMLIGSPKFARTTLQLANGKKLVIRRDGGSTAPVSAEWNGIPCESLRLTASDMMEGGELVIHTA